MAFDFVFTRRSYRAEVLDVIDKATEWSTSHHISICTGLTYQQTIFALVALHSQNKIARSGRTFRAKWGPLSLLPVTEDSYALLQSLFNGSIKR